MKFSIIIPCYKVEQYLHECVNSVLKQSYSDFEVILIDDGSPDSCPQICDEYALKDNRIKVIHQKNAGVACARNAGIKVASGEYIICIDSDDYLCSNEILQQIANKTVNETDVILYGFRKFFESTKALGYTEYPVLDRPCSTLTMLNKVLSSNSYCGTAWTKAVKRSILINHHIEFRPGMISEDIDWYLQLLCYAKTFDSINGVAIIYRQRAGSISHAPKLKSLTDNLWILENWPDKFKSLIDDIDTINALMSVMAYYYANDLILYSAYRHKEVSAYKARLKKQDYLLNYSATPRALTIKKFYNLFGFEITTVFLKLLSSIKTRK